MSRCSLYATVRDARPLREAEFRDCAETFPVMMGRVMGGGDAEARAWLREWLLCGDARVEQLASVYRALPGMDPERRRRAKQEWLPACVPAGTFDGSHAQANLRELSGVVTFDFDHTGDARAAAERLARLPFIDGAAPSCSGSGAYAWAHLDVLSTESFRRVTSALTQSDYFVKAAGTAPDAACKDVSRARYLSPYLAVLHEGAAESADGWLAAHADKATLVKTRNPWSCACEQNAQAAPDNNPADERARRRLRRLARESVRLGADLTESETAWFLVLGVYARAFAHDEGLALAQQISSLYPAYDPEETRRKFEHAYAGRGAAWTAARLFEALEQAGLLSAGWRHGLIVFNERMTSKQLKLKRLEGVQDDKDGKDDVQDGCQDDAGWGSGCSG